jgi:hypothetical protein
MLTRCKAQRIERAAQALVAARDACQDDDIIRNLDPELDALRAALSLTLSQLQNEDTGVKKC